MTLDSQTKDQIQEALGERLVKGWTKIKDVNKVIRPIKMTAISDMGYDSTKDFLQACSGLDYDEDNNKFKCADGGTFSLPGGGDSDDERPRGRSSRSKPSRQESGRSRDSRRDSDSDGGRQDSDASAEEAPRQKPFRAEKGSKRDDHGSEDAKRAARAVFKTLPEDIRELLEYQGEGFKDKLLESLYDEDDSDTWVKGKILQRSFRQFFPGSNVKGLGYSSVMQFMEACLGVEIDAKKNQYRVLDPDTFKIPGMFKASDVARAKTVAVAAPPRQQSFAQSEQMFTPPAAMYQAAPQAMSAAGGSMGIPAEFEIIYAAYGSRDISSSVKKDYRKGVRQFVANSAVWGDPDQGFTKSLMVVYRDPQSAEMTHHVAFEGQALILP